MIKLKVVECYIDDDYDGEKDPYCVALGKCVKRINKWKKTKYKILSLNVNVNETTDCRESAWVKVYIFYEETVV